MRSCRRAGIITFFAFLFIVFSHLVLAIPAQKDVSESSASSSTPTSSPSTSTDAQATHAPAHGPAPDDKGDATQTDPIDHPSEARTGTSTSSRHSILIPPTAHHSHPHPSFTTSPGHPITHHFPPPSPPPTVAPPSRPVPADKGQPPIAIAFEVLGGVIALLVLLGLLRCFIVWRRTPPRDRIAALVSRHQLEREMEEQERERIERLSRALEARRWRPPPPPYQPAPQYEEVVRSDSPS
ncbi:hypothetical protein BN946_scf185015.g71 [Trametes cinnabarina]|uniref:Transmembrane protein n=1 Tax=Pycnoporus cinnabarinus TaxID=5643 RepID=A0A060SMT9_PYCCI|nr:hypothetical protein BN946_scf185015.g71 [Trametes cinnabarina]